MKFVHRRQKPWLFTSLCLGLLLTAFSFLSIAPLKTSALTTVNWTAGGAGYLDDRVIATMTFDDNWSGKLTEAGGSGQPIYHEDDLAIHFSANSFNGDGNEMLIYPHPYNIDQVIRKFELTTALGQTPDIKLFVGETEETLVEVTPMIAWDGVVFRYTGTTDIRFIKFKNAHIGANNLKVYIKAIDLEYEKGTYDYDPVTSVSATTHDLQTIYVGESLTVTPTILPYTASQDFILEVDMPYYADVSGHKIIGLHPTNSLSVKVTTCGTDSSGVHLTTTFNLKIVQATTTVSTAKGLTPNTDIIYRVENIVVRDGYNTTSSHQILIADSLGSSETMLISHLNINEINSYRYIAGGTLSFKAKIADTGEGNFFTDFSPINYTDEVEVFASEILAGNDVDQCIARFPGFKATVLAFDAIELAKIQNGTSTAITNARTRYLAWAAALGEKPWEEGLVGLHVSDDEKTTNVNLIIIIAITGCFFVALIYFRDKKIATE